MTGALASPGCRMDARGLHELPGLHGQPGLAAARSHFIITVFPLFADKLAAASISITTMLFSREERSYGGSDISPLTTAAKCAKGSL